MGTSGPYTHGIPNEPHHFGQRVRTARAYAGGMTRADLAARIETVFRDELPKSGVSSTTIKRLESGETVRGSINDWARRISTVTEVPEWFLLADWEGAAAVVWEAPVGPNEMDEQAMLLEMQTHELAAALAAIRDLLERQRLMHRNQFAWLTQDLPRRLRTYSAPESDDVLTFGNLAQVFIRRGGLIGDLGARLIKFAEGETLSEDDRRKLFEEVTNALKEPTVKAEVDTLQLHQYPPHPPGELGRGAREHLPNTRDREQSQTPEAPDARADTGG